VGAKSRITSKGQITMPKEVRDRLGLKPGDAVEFIEDGNRTWVRARNRSVMELAGILHRPGMKPVSLEEMESAILDAAAGDDLRIRREWSGKKS
jgi:antitoxin PrlF